MKKILFIILVFGSHFLSIAQPGALDLSFDAKLPPGCEVYAVAVQNDKKIIIGGLLFDVNGILGKHIARLHPNGSLDTTFNIGSGFNLFVYSIALQTNGKILVGGIFSSYNGLTSNRIVRLNEDGTMDTTFHVGAGFNFNSEVRTIKLQSDEKHIGGG